MPLVRLTILDVQIFKQVLLVKNILELVDTLMPLTALERLKVFVF